MVKKKLSKRIAALITVMLVTISCFSETLVAFAATTKNTEYSISDWGYDFSNSGLPNAYDPLTQKRSNTAFRYKWSQNWYYWKDSDGAISYCVQLGTSHVDSATMDKWSFKDEEKINSFYPNRNQSEYMKRATIYSYKGTSKYGYDWKTELVASQALIWSVSGGYFDGSSTLLSSNERKLLQGIKAPTSKDWNNMVQCYKYMKADILSHKTIPSGTVAALNPNALKKATYELTYHASSERWVGYAQLDSNLSRFTLEKIDGVAYYISGSTLKVVATNDGMQTLKTKAIQLTKTKAKYASKIEKCTPVFLTVQNGSSSQAKVSYISGEDPVPAYLKFTPTTSTTSLTKEFIDSDGEKQTATSDLINAVAFKLKYSYAGEVYYIIADGSKGSYTFKSVTSDVNKGTTFKLSSASKITVTDLPNGNYRWIETAHPDYYVPTEVPFKIENKNISLKAENYEEREGEYRFVKKFAAPDGSEYDYRFMSSGEDYVKLLGYMQQSEFFAYTKDANGTVKYLTLTQTGAGRYDITGYAKDRNSATKLKATTESGVNFGSIFISSRDDIPTVCIKELKSNFKFGVADGDAVAIRDGQTKTLVNTEQTFKVRLTKTDAENGNYVAGALYELRAAEDVYNAFGRKIYSAGEMIEQLRTTGAAYDTFTTDLLITGKYYVKELYAPSGYLIDNTKYDVSYNNGTDEVINVTAVGNKTVAVKSSEKPIELKIDKKTVYGAELAGAQMQLISADGTVVDEWTSTSEPHVIKRLTSGVYTIHEIAAPDGYTIATDIKFTLGIDNKVSGVSVDAVSTDANGVPTITMVDDTTKVKISKQDITTQEELAGAALQIIDGDTIVDEWTSTSEPHYIEGKLTAGKTYILREITAPDGYVIANDVEFTVNEDGTVTEVVMYDDTTKVKISKQDITNGAELAGAALQIIDGDTIVDEWTSTSEPHYIDGKLTAGKTYILRETIAPNGYTLTSDIEFTVNSDGSVTSVIMYDSDMTGSIVISKRTEGMLNIEGIEFVLSGTSDSGRDIKLTAKTDKNGVAMFKNIPIGTYTITENGSTVPTGYLVADPEEVTVMYAQTTNVKVKNEEKTGSIQIQKRTEGMTDIEGIEFILSGTSDSGRDIKLTAKTDKDGVATFENIPVGTYTITENGSTVPTGYLVADSQSVTVMYAEQTNVIIINDKIPETPPETPNTPPVETPPETPNTPPTTDKPPVTGAGMVGVPMILIFGGIIVSARKKTNDRKE